MPKFKTTSKITWLGQESIDPVVFFKICLVGYINNIISDRELVSFCSDSLSIRLFLGYDIDEELPGHSTINRTRQLYGEEAFKQLFEQVFEKCMECGMIAGHPQAIDGAFLKANTPPRRPGSRRPAAYALQRWWTNQTAQRPGYKIPATGKKLWRNAWWRQGQIPQ